MTGVAEDFWEPHYRQHRGVWTGRPNPILVEVATPTTPGSALDLGCGEGGDAIWLARHGWQVTAVDISATALDRAATHAAAAGVSEQITFEQHDLARSLPTGRSFDLVSAQYLHSPVDFPRARVLHRAADLLAPGGLLLIVGHASVHPWSWADPDTRFPTPAEELALLELDPAHWNPERLDRPQRTATGPDGQTATVTDSVITVRRLQP